MPFSFPHKNPGDVIKSNEWNELMDEIDKRVKIPGDTMTGPLQINTSLGFGSQVRQMINLWSTEYAIGVQASTQYYRTNNGFAWYRGGVHDDAMQKPGTGGARMMALNGAGDLVLSGRSNPDNDPAKSMCRALVNWKAAANTPDELHVNWDNDFGGGTFIDSVLNVRYDVFFNGMLRFGTSTASDQISIDRGAFNRGGFIVIGGGGPVTQNLLVSMANINSGNAVPDYNFAVGHWVNTPGGGGPFGFQLPSSSFEAKFRVYMNGNTKCDGSFIGGGADYAELLESETGTTIPIGCSVIFTGNGKVRKAGPEDTPIGVVSSSPAMLGNNPGEWPGKYLRDETGAVIMVDGAPQLNPEYDPSQAYVQRFERPEWNKIGILGQLRLQKGQPTAPGWVKIRDISENWELWLVK